MTCKPSSCSLNPRSLNWIFIRCRRNSRRLTCSTGLEPRGTMKIPPVEVISNWPKPNYINPETRAPAGRVIGSILLVLATIILAIRLYSRKKLTKGCGLDDLLICLAYLPAAAFTITGITTQEEFGWARHIWDIEPKYFKINIILTYRIPPLFSSADFLTHHRLIHLFLFDLATNLTKLSMLAMVRRLTAVSNNKLEKAAVLTLVIFITANCFIFIMVEIFQCRPISSAWMLHRDSHNCINEEAHLMVANVINTATDFAVVLLPIQTAMRARLTPRQRTIVISLFGIGLIGSAAGISRTYFTWHQFHVANYDVTWRAWYVWLSSLIELHLGIVSVQLISALDENAFQFQTSNTNPVLVMRYAPRSPRQNPSLQASPRDGKYRPPYCRSSPHHQDRIPKRK
ncbi:hypothetical protein F5Y07DRAFT_233545 [Xylaria sp. FL0933]|nr:hypothetical protein F5Y07DRAFT_233545 [Xylaria sp. FL0933]